MICGKVSKSFHRYHCLFLLQDEGIIWRKLYQFGLLKSAGFERNMVKHCSEFRTILYAYKNDSGNDGGKGCPLSETLFFTIADDCEERE